MTKKSIQRNMSKTDYNGTAEWGKWATGCGFGAQDVRKPITDCKVEKASFF